MTLLFLFTALYAIGQDEKLYTEIFTKTTRVISDFEVIDTSNICVLYTMNADEKQANKIDFCEDLQVLEIGNNISKYYSYFLFKSDSITEIANRKLIGRLHSPLELKGIPSWSEFFKDFKTGILTEYARMPVYIPNFHYSETITDQNWELLEDTLTVAGYLCQKAQCRFRGRNYTAWFALDIPVNNGPWKFGGLPGLILKVSDDEKKFVFECVEIKQNKNLIKTFDYNDYKKITREKLLDLFNAIDKDYFKISIRVTEVKYNTGIPIGKTKIRPKYNTMLLELE
jgi:GLPGLI family protein